MENYDLAVIGGGPAGLAAAAAAKEAGVNSIVILERDQELGGILNQCIHNGFGLHTFKEELTGPEYADRFIQQVQEKGIEYRLNTMVIDFNEQKELTLISREKGLLQMKAKAVILAMGCRERPRGALNIPGYRPAGIYTAGTAQRFVNIEGFLPGKEVVILGSGDIGLIMARRMTLEGAKVKLVAELMSYSGGLKRNIVQCLNDFDIPLMLNHTVIDVDGMDRLKGVTIAQVDENKKPISGTEQYISCDTLLLSVGLLPENELSREAGIELSEVTSGPIVDHRFETSLHGIFACGNVLHVHDLVDFVSEEAQKAGQKAADYIQGKSMLLTEFVPICPEQGVRYTVPQKICPDQMDDAVTVRFRVDNTYRNCFVTVFFDGEQIQKKKKRILTPGEMEHLIFQKQELSKYPNLREIKIKIEEA